MLLVRDVLDEQIEDVDGRNAGRVDGIVLELRPEAPPRVSALVVSPVTVCGRVSARLGRLVERLVHRLHLPITCAHIPMSRIASFTGVVKLDVEASRVDGLLRAEDWTRDHVVRHIPGSGVR